jgi:undecaprenyl-diphosphatase
MEGDTLAFDRAVLLLLRHPDNLALPIGPDWLRETMIDVTALGSFSVLTVIGALAAGYLFAARKPGIAIFTIAALAGGGALSTFLKSLFVRARPEVVEHLVGTNSTSFPSGHAMNSAIAYLTLAVLLARAETSRALRIYLVSAAIALTLLVGFSRLYLGVHWPSDVAAGWIVGALWAAGCSLVAKRLQSRSTIESPGATE